MMKLTHFQVLVACAALCASTATASNAIRAGYRCGAHGAKLGLPAGVFTVRYTGSGMDSKATLPFHGRQLVLSATPSAGGARYEAGRYVWWDAPKPSFTMDEGKPGSATVECRHIE